MSTSHHEASLAQIEAARPDRSTWLSANAGSGKTRVLTNRVARLLLSGVNPQNILCLTYTKAAASEMQNRLFKRLGTWAMKPNEALINELTDLGESGATTETLAEARRLFARAIETPGGLRIQTIHSFCASLLRRFPLEAGVTPQFTELDDRTATLLREQVLDNLAQNDEDSLRALARVIGGNDIEKLTRQIVTHKATFLKDIERPAYAVELRELLGIKPEVDNEAVLSSVFLGGELELLNELKTALLAGSPTEVKNAAKLAAFTDTDMNGLMVLETIVLYGGGAEAPFGAKAGKFPTKATRKKISHLTDALDALMLRVEEARPQRIALGAVENSVTVHRFAQAFLLEYEHLKAQRGLLDFDDLILKTKDLLTNPDVAQWVLFRLDGGIDHILVDEAQDTSPAQWSVIQELAREIIAGDSSQTEKERTVFVVGDKKQSIYSFQGADSREFNRMRANFKDKLSHHVKPLASRSLAYSFRSSAAILDVVDEVFPNADGDESDRHIAFHQDMPGRVDIWPVVEKDQTADKPHWYQPVDLVSSQSPVSILARKIASQIRKMISDKILIPTNRDKTGAWSGRPVHEGDFLILMQTRSPLFHEIIRACKAAGLDVAGADKLAINDELAVKDITALLSFLVTQDDDLSLAAALRSPLFGWTEQDLFSLSHGRKGSLWEALRKQSKLHPDTLDTLQDLRNQTDYSRPYELIERILSRHGGRKKLLKRLGHEAEDAIDAFLGQALAYERLSVPSLTGFLGWLEADDPEIKRDIEAGGQRIRVMTVHGSKGLESPIVIMPDTTDKKNDIRDMVLPFGDTIIWKQPYAASPAPFLDSYKDKQGAQAAERERLLYVSMTRAEKWLIVAAAGDTKKAESWFNRISSATGALKFSEQEDGSKRYEVGDWPDLNTKTKPPETSSNVALESYFFLPAPPASKALKALSPSGLGGAKALAGELGQDEEQAKLYGTQVHKLLEVLPNLPSDSWKSVAFNLLGEGFEAALAEAVQTLKAPHLAFLFSSGTLAEVTLSSPSDTLGRRLHGVIDRLVLTDSSVLIVDYKTNAILPKRPEDTPTGLLRQLGSYAEAAKMIWPARSIETAIVWTKTAELMKFDHDLVMSALSSTPYLDAPRSAS